MANQFSREDVNKILNQAAKSGITDDDLNNAKNGNFDSIANKLKPEDAEKFKEIAQNKEMQEKLLNSPHIQALIKKFLNNQ